MRDLRIMAIVVCMAQLAGCHYGLIAKKHSEMNCPTDIRQTHAWVFGEDAIFWGPCGISSGFYGHRATQWRDWPMSVGEWRAASNICPTVDPLYCPPPLADGQLMPQGPLLPGEPVPGPLDAPLPYTPEPLPGSPQ